VTPVGGTYYAHIVPGLTGYVDTLLPALLQVERGVIIDASEDAAVPARVAGRFAAAGIATQRVSMPDTQALKTFRAVRGVTADDQGEAVALGMMAAAYLAFRQGRIPRTVVERAAGGGHLFERYVYRYLSLSSGTSAVSACSSGVLSAILAPRWPAAL
jgi:hypothetical protein